MDKALIHQRFARAAATYDNQASVQRGVARKLARLVDRHVPRDGHARVWEVGCGTGLFTRFYLASHRPHALWLNDLCPEVEAVLSPLLGEHTHFVPGDVETVAWPGALTLVTSCSAVQWLDRPLAFLERCQSSLAGGGCVALALYGADNLHELRTLAGSTLPYLSLGEWTAEAARQGYRILHAGEERVRLSFDTPEAVLRHLQQTGVTGISRRRWTRRQLADFCQGYRERFTDASGRVTLTYHPLYLIIQKDA